jgi:hypothetical protein
LHAAAAEMDSLHVSRSFSKRSSVSAIMRNVLMHAAEHPNVASLIVLEALQNEGKYYCETSLGSLYGPLIESLRRGMLNVAILPRLTHCMSAANLVGMSIFYTTLLARQPQESLARRY